MAANIPVRVQAHGIEQAQRAFLRYAEVSGPVLKKVLEASGAEVVRNCKDRCPVDTGRLKGSIGEVDNEGIWELVETSHMLKLKVGTSVEYAYDVEVLPNYHEVGQAHYMEEGANASVPRIQDYFEQGMRQLERGVA